MPSNPYGFLKAVAYVLMALAGSSVWSFVACKSANTSFTHDEAYTYTRYVRLHFMDIISYKPAFTNNHIL